MNYLRDILYKIRKNAMDNAMCKYLKIFRESL